LALPFANDEEQAVPKNLIQHIEWTTRDPARLKSFFSRIFDWNFSDAMPGYTLIEGVGGVFEAPDPQMPVVITPYVNVADLRETEAKASAAGATVHKSRQEVPGRGWFSILSDPDGNLLGLWEPLMRAPASSAATTRRAAARKPAKKAARKTAKKAARKAARKPAKKAAKKAGRKRARR
jgi:predicted enzyme related to lactoylglutathione lyase